MTTKKTLVISPHVDDELLGCFSFLNEDAHVVECGVDVFHVVSREERLQELKNLSDHCGFSYDVYLENKVNNYVMQDLIPIFEEQINKVKPDKVFIPYPSYNQDHIAVYDAALVALRHHDINFFVKKVLVYEEVHSFLWDCTHDLNSSFKPNYFSPLDIDDKVFSYNFLKSQVRGHRGPDTLRQMAYLRGFQSNMLSAESFQIIRWVD